MQASLSDYESARANYTQAVVAHDFAVFLAPKHLSAHANSGIALLKLANLHRTLAEREQARAVYLKAISAFDRALAIAPQYKLALNNRGIALYSLAELLASLSETAPARATFADAITALDSAADVLGSGANVYWGRVHARIGFGDFLLTQEDDHDGAKASWTEALSIVGRWTGDQFVSGEVASITSEIDHRLKGV